MRFLIVTAIAVCSATYAQAADVPLIEDKINAPYAPKYSPAPEPEAKCHLSAAFGLIKLPCSDRFVYEEPEGEDDTPISKPEDPKDPPKCEKPNRGDKGKGKGKDRGKKDRDDRGKGKGKGHSGGGKGKGKSNKNR